MYMIHMWYRSVNLCAPFSFRPQLQMFEYFSFSSKCWVLDVSQNRSKKDYRKKTREENDQWRNGRHENRLISEHGRFQWKRKDISTKKNGEKISAHVPLYCFVHKSISFHFTLTDHMHISRMLCMSLHIRAYTNE